VILVSEDVWSADFEALAQEFTVVREPDLWNKKEDLKAKISTATALIPSAAATTTPFSSAALTSMLSRPTPARAIT